MFFMALAPSGNVASINYYSRFSSKLLVETYITGFKQGGQKIDRYVLSCWQLDLRIYPLTSTETTRITFKEHLDILRCVFLFLFLLNFEHVGDDT